MCSVWVYVVDRRVFGITYRVSTLEELMYAFNGSHVVFWNTKPEACMRGMLRLEVLGRSENYFCNWRVDP